jgi:putative Mg2+ transporter-C (MgtC) family protein
MSSLSPELVDTLFRMAAAAAVGMLIGLNRDLRGKAAGMRTLGLVALGAAIVTDAAIDFPAFAGHPDAQSRVLQGAVQGVLTGVGFLGAGVVMHQGLSVHGLTTGAAVWVTAALGVACALASWPLAAVGLGLALLILVLPSIEHGETKGDDRR